MTAKKPLPKRPHSARNNKLYDGWSLVHFATCVLLGWLITPVVAILLAVAWEPLEILVLSPILARHGSDFGFETLRNSLSDIVVDTVGVLVGYHLLTQLLQPPFHLF